MTGGTVNTHRNAISRSGNVGADSVLSKIVQMVAEAQRSRAIQRLVDQVAGWFVPIVIVTSIITFIVWAIFGPSPLWPMLWLTRLRY